MIPLNCLCSHVIEEYFLLFHDIKLCAMLFSHLKYSIKTNLPVNAFLDMTFVWKTEHFKKYVIVIFTPHPKTDGGVAKSGWWCLVLCSFCQILPEVIFLIISLYVSFYPCTVKSFNFVGTKFCGCRHYAIGHVCGHLNSWISNYNYAI